METIYNPAIRAVILYFTLLILARIMGRKMISQMTFFDFVVGITIGSVAASSTLGPYSTSLGAGIAVLVVLTTLVVLIGYLHIKSFRFRKLVDSEAVVVIERGQIVDKNLKRERFTIQELTALLRQKNIFNLSDVEFALLEHDGKLSVLPKSNKQPLKPIDMNISTPYQGLMKDVVIDGIIMKENLEDALLTESDLMKKLQFYGFENVRDVFYAGVDSAGNLYVSKRNDQQETDGKYGIE
ncbi:DUF421 domain-containing protein [Alkaliphilus transvaalensis]|uniref:DUF421 domain-containing protein n=1 Tax=Alkaliphilus transvaalensis TaxID=114628 RepID=UPI00047C7939|nr:DUF421 domain-containing protein [Alkaliphilus transvaalensis]